VKTLLIRALLGSLIFAGLTLLASSAQAQRLELNAPIASPAPPEPGTQLSEIDGQLVPVGSHSEYYYDSHRLRPWVIGTNPFGLLLGIYSVGVSYASSDNLAIHVDFSLYSAAMDSDLDGWEGSVNLPIYFRKMYSGFYLEPGLMYRSFSMADIHQAELGPQVLLGWHWSWDSGWNVAFAYGLGRNVSASRESETNLFVNGYLRVGYQY